MTDRPSLPETHQAIRLHPSLNNRDIRFETLPRPKIVHPDDVIVKIKYAGLCGSDLHGYRGNEKSDVPYVTGHEFYGEVVELGSSFHFSTETTKDPSDVTVNEGNRTSLYSKLSTGDIVIGSFTVTCDECEYCRVGFTSRCIHSQLFGSPDLAGAQAQFIRVPKAGGTLHRVSDLHSSPSSNPEIHEAAFLLLGDVLPTGYFAALQALSHPNVQVRLEGKAPYPISTGIGNVPWDGHTTATANSGQSIIVRIGVVGLGPIGMCAVLSLLAIFRANRPYNFQILAIDPLEQRRRKAERIVQKIPWLRESSTTAEVHTASPDEASATLKALCTNNHGGLVGLMGCDAVLDAVGSNAALQLSYELIRHFGVISSVGVHTAPTLALNGDHLYSKNVSLCFGRCPVGGMFQHAASLFREYPEVLGTIGKEDSLLDRVVGMSNEAEAKEAYDKFDSGEWGKLVFRPWN